MNRRMLFLFFLFLMMCPASHAQQDVSGKNHPGQTEKLLWEKDPDYGYMRTLARDLREKNSKELARAQRSRNRDNSGSVLDKFRSLFESNSFKAVLWVLLGVFGLFLIYRTGNFLKLTNRKTESGETVTEESVSQLKSAVFYDSSISAAESEKDFSEAVRLNFLKLLAGWSAAEIIEFLPEKTNAEYLAEIPAGPERNNFNMLAAIYERVWYGKFKLNETQYRGIKELFNQHFK